MPYYSVLNLFYVVAQYKQVIIDTVSKITSYKCQRFENILPKYAINMLI